MTYDLTPAPPVNWPALRVEWSRAKQAVNDELDTIGHVRLETLQRMRQVEARGEAVLAIQLARIPTE